MMTGVEMDDWSWIWHSALWQDGLRMQSLAIVTFIYKTGVALYNNESLDIGHPWSKHKTEVWERSIVGVIFAEIVSIIKSKEELS